MNNKRYTPDLAEILSQCELNYAIVMRLLPELKAMVKRQLPVEQGGHWRMQTEALLVELKVSDRSRYTTTMVMQISNQKVQLAKDVQLIVRLYHDAQLMEVMEGSGPSALKAVYEHPNKGMKTKDEKEQVNRYVGECLKACSQVTPTEIEGMQS